LRLLSELLPLVGDEAATYAGVAVGLRVKGNKYGGEASNVVGDCFPDKPLARTPTMAKKRSLHLGLMIFGPPSGLPTNGDLN
jgi:hypothetical protein